MLNILINLIFFLNNFIFLIIIFHIITYIFICSLRKIVESYIFSLTIFFIFVIIFKTNNFRNISRYSFYLFLNFFLYKFVILII